MVGTTTNAQNSREADASGSVQTSFHSSCRTRKAVTQRHIFQLGSSRIQSRDSRLRGLVQVGRSGVPRRTRSAAKETHRQRRSRDDLLDTSSIEVRDKGRKCRVLKL